MTDQREDEEVSEERQPIGSIWFLTQRHPGLVLTTIILGSTGVVLVLRAVFEGRLYDYSRSSFPGDILLGVHAAVLAFGLRKNGMPNGIHESRKWHSLVLSSSIIGGIVLQFGALISHGGRDTVANIYHNLVVIPALGYLIVSSLPVLIAQRRRQSSRLAAVALLGWVVFAIYDLRHGNLTKNTPANI